jgi:hypothetical protein
VGGDRISPSLNRSQEGGEKELDCRVEQRQNHSWMPAYAGMVIVIYLHLIHFFFDDGVQLIHRVIHCSGI